jgi:thiol-disulfide isomerase/thioredoxin
MKQRRSALLWALALVFLAAVIVFVNLPDSRQKAVTAAAQGSAVGEELPDFTVTCLDGSDFTLSQHRGKTVVINLWATWCGPCVKELGSFDRLQREHPEAVSVLALHSEMVTEDVAAFLSAFDYQMPFAVDREGDLIARLGGSTVLPQTLIIDPDGIVIYNKVGSLSEAALNALVFPSDGES